MDVNLLREAVTVVSFLVFIGIVAFAVHPKNRSRFEAAARAPLDEDVVTLTPGPSPKGDGSRDGARA